MKTFRSLLVLAGLTAALNALAADAKPGCCKKNASCCGADQTCCAPASTSTASVTTAPAGYPLTTCVVSGDKLGDMGEPYQHIHKQAGKPDRVVLFCCKGCVKDFEKEPAKYLKLLDEAAAAKAKA